MASETVIGWAAVVLLGLTLGGLAWSTLMLRRNEVVFRHRRRWLDDLGAASLGRITARDPRWAARGMKNVNQYALSDAAFGTYDQMLYRRPWAWTYRALYPVPADEWLDALLSGREDPNEW